MVVVSSFTFSLAELLTKYRLKSNLSSDILAAKLGVSFGNTQKLGVLPDQAQQAILVKNS